MTANRPYSIGAMLAFTSALPSRRMNKESGLKLYEDRRLFYPGLFRPAHTFAGPFYALKENDPYDPDIHWTIPHRKKTPKPGTLPPILKEPEGVDWYPGMEPFPKRAVMFDESNKVIICLKRKIRREMMHAMGIAGKLGGKPHRNYYSNVRC